jgi:hypothetical protein
MTIFKHCASRRNILKDLLRLPESPNTNEQHIQTMLTISTSGLGVC